MTTPRKLSFSVKIGHFAEKTIIFRRNQSFSIQNLALLIKIGDFPSKIHVFNHFRSKLVNFCLKCPFLNENERL